MLAFKFNVALLSCAYTRWPRDSGYHVPWHMDMMEIFVSLFDCHMAKATAIHVFTFGFERNVLRPEHSLMNHISTHRRQGALKSSVDFFGIFTATEQCDSSNRPSEFRV